ncbi:MAG: beta-ketoacyl-ACP synthase, partial [Propionibacteriaceae bacterium]|nr:beta-ketoacyl-ACP synthase [Propionibacteriaceae bacterium]
DADLAACDLAHVNAHATSTPAGDLTEARAIRDALGAAADRAVVTAVKSQTGHLLGAAGALEAIATLLALGERIVPPTINLDEPEPGLPVDVATAPRTLPATGQLAGLNNSFGFGGHNVAVVLTTAHRTGGLALTRSEAPAG